MNCVVDRVASAAIALSIGRRLRFEAGRRAPIPHQPLTATRAWCRNFPAFGGTGRQTLHLIDQLARGLNTVLQAFALRASYVDMGIAPTKLEPCVTSSEHH